MKTSDFYYDLPPELIAQTPLEKRDESRLLCLDKATGEWSHHHFYELPDFLRAGDCLILNNSRVLPARLLGHRLPGGGACEVLLLQDKGDKVWEYKQAFILANFNGSSGDVDVVTHEFGHTIAFDFAMNREDRSVGIGSNETAETHSMSMEFLAWKFMDKFFRNPDEYKYKHLSDALSFIPYGVIVDEFQHIVYENPDMTPSERDAAYLELEKKYRPYLSFDGIPYLEEGTRWQYQMHIYETLSIISIIASPKSWRWSFWSCPRKTTTKL